MIREDLEYQVIFPRQADSVFPLAFRESRLVEFRKSLTQERSDWLLFKTGIEEGGHRVEGEEEDRPDHAEPAGQEGRRESWSLVLRNLLVALHLKVAREAGRLSGQSSVLNKYLSSKYLPGPAWSIYIVAIQTLVIPGEKF